MLPAHQGFHARDPATADIAFSLMVKLEFAVLQGLPQARLQIT